MNRNILIHKLHKIKLVAERLPSTKFYALLWALVTLVGLLVISPAIYSLVSSAIPTHGQIQANWVTTKTGSAKDIQAAVDIAASTGGGNVYIPAGTFNFVEVGQPWMTVNIPAGVNLFGARNTRYANGSNVSWNTILIMPYDIPGTVDAPSLWFTITGNGDPSKATRFSDIKLVGYRSIDPTSTNENQGISISNTIDFRVDHSSFEHTTQGAVSVWGLQSRGVIDHNKIYNVYGYDVLTDYQQSTIGYGIMVQAGWTAPFLPTASLLGDYSSPMVFIEDNYFSKWRHVVSSGHGGYYVFRYNIIDQDFGHFSLDVHGLRDSQYGYAGGRGAEIYENRFTNAVPGDFDALFQDGGGAGVWFNNYVDNSYRAESIALYTEDAVASTTWHLKDFYLWSNEGPWTPPAWNGVVQGFTADRYVEAYWNRPAYNLTDSRYPNVDPSWSIAGYKPYVYPHPLTLAP